MIPQRQLEFMSGCRPPARAVERRPAGSSPAPQHVDGGSPRPSAGTKGSRSDRTVTPCSPAARASSGSRVPMARWVTSQVERSRGAENRGWPCPIISEAATRRPGSWVWSGRRPRTLTGGRSQVDDVVFPSASTGTIRAEGSPTRTSTAPLTRTTITAATWAIHRPSRPAPAPNANSARAARTRPAVGCANESSRRPLNSSACRDGHVTASDRRRPGLPRRPPSQQRPDPAQHRPICRPRAIISDPNGDESLHGVGIEHDLDMQRQPFSHRPHRQPSQHKHRPTSSSTIGQPESGDALDYEDPDGTPRLGIDPLGPVPTQPSLAVERLSLCARSLIHVETSLKVLARPRGVGAPPGPPMSYLRNIPNGCDNDLLGRIIF